MKKIVLLLLAAAAVVGCKEEVKEDMTPAVNDEQIQEMAYMSYGEKIDASNAIDAVKLGSFYESMKEGDTMQIKVKGMIQDVCVNKGCWIKLPVNDTETAFVKFKDYGFFLPKNGTDKEVILSGKAYKSITPKDELIHYAQDAGESEEEIAKITEDKVTYAFMADGALVEEFENPDVEGMEPSTEE
ncbi:DUF4920 domain-containing protein [Nonlabens arenilitoris]|uniref:DUF4920 domain-containing protein n=1 Tax=Nonlabens arenilitoris TaxID=1217969 RepID=A0A2S7UD36_9FLAO|nr:DUF4920 domain-containing protein [Nonlabens arenilitoris]PQJ32799.1 DUF4920 domain-containing protein [Nonlabens arenilitoris]